MFSPKESRPSLLLFIPRFTKGISVKELLLITGLSICLLGCNSTRTKYAEPTTFAPYSLATLNVIGDNVSSDFFRLDGAESYIFFTDAFLPIDDTSRKACKTLAKCKKILGNHPSVALLVFHQNPYGCRRLPRYRRQRKRDGNLTFL